MKKLILGTVVALAVISATAAESVSWLTDLPKAQAQAKTEKKLVMLDFTGSDWCGWCIKLNNEVFSQPEFVEYAKKNVVCVEVDFPNKKKLSPEQKKANDALAAKYKIEGYPTIIVPLGTIPTAPDTAVPQGFAARPSPYGVSFTGLACSEPPLLGLAVAFEQAPKRRVPPPFAP